jgi:hypothetical protein
MFKGKLLHRDLDMGTDTGTTGKLDAAADNCNADIRDLDHVSVFVNQLTDAGTATILVEKTFDGVNYSLVSTLTEASFPAGANKAVEVTLSDANGMPTRAVSVRVTLSAVAGGGAYSAHVAGAAVGHHT